MSKKWPGGIITPTPATPAGPYENGAASGIWTLDQQMQFKQQGIWPIAGNVPNYIEDVFSTYLYTGDGTLSRAIDNGIDLAGKGGLVWLRERNPPTSADHCLVSSATGASNALRSNTTDALASGIGLGSFTSTGFTTSSANAEYFRQNSSGRNLVTWTFRKQAKFFDVVTFTAPSSGDITINHSLGSVPGCVIFKRTDAAQSWIVNHRSLSNTEYLILNSSTGLISSGALSVSYSATTVTYSAGYMTPNAQYVAYIYAHDAGGFGLTGTDNVISCGSFTTNGSGNASINLGYEPQWVLVKPAGQAGNWDLMDTMRGFAQTSVSRLQPNTSSAEGTVAGNYLFPTATGFELAQNFYGLTSTQFIYIAIRRGPMKVPTDGTKVFAPVAYTGNGATGQSFTQPNFAPDLIWTKNRGAANWDNLFMDRLRGTSRALDTNNTAREGSSSGYYVTQYDSLGWTLGTTYGSYNTSGNTYVAGAFRRAPSFFDEVCWTGDGTGDRALTHNLGIAPEMMILKCRNTSGTNWSWWVYHKDIPNTPYPTNMMLNSTDAAYAWGSNINTPTSTTFTVRDAFGNGSGYTFVSYLFATCPGVSKVGSYTGNGSSQTINCGFTGGARFVLIKRTDATGEWYVYDTARGMTTLTDPYLLLNSTAAESATLGSVTTVATGFALNATILAAINASGGSYIFLAIA